MNDEFEVQRQVGLMIHNENHSIQEVYEATTVNKITPDREQRRFSIEK